MTDLVERAVAIRLGDRGQATPALAELVVGVERGGLVVHDASGVRRDSLDDVMAALGRRPAWRRPVIGDAPMTDREAVVSRGVARGATTRELAEELGVSERTVTTLRRRLREREPAAEVVGGSRGVSVVGAPGLTRDVVHTCLRAERADVNEVPSVRADDRVRVMVAPTVRDFAAVGRARFVVVGELVGELTVVEAIEAGMVAHLPVATTTLDHLCRAIDDAAAGRPTLPPPTLHRLVDEAWNEGATTSELSPRDLDVVQGIRAGESVKQTARRLGVSRKTVENGRHRLFLRFGVHSAAELDRAVGPL